MAQGRRRAAEGARRRPRPRPGAVTDDLVTGDNVFFVATGITDGELLKGVRYRGDGAVRTHSIVMRSRSGTIRARRERAPAHKLRAYSAIDFESAGS